MSVTVSKGYQGTHTESLAALERNIDAVLNQIKNATQTGMSRWVDAVMEDVAPRVPVDTGNLQASGFKVKRGTKSVPRPVFNSYGETPGRQAKLARAYQFYEEVTTAALAKANSFVGTKTAIIIFGYPLEYAWRVHEDIEADQNENRPPGEAKFLENAVTALLPELPEMCADAVREAMGRTRAPRTAVVPVNPAALLKTLGGI